MSDQINKKPVAICDTEPIAIEGMRTLLNQCDDLFLAAAETSLLGGMEMLRQHSPAIMILDRGFGIHAVMDCLQRLRASGSGVAPMVWGVNLNESEALRMMQVGALGVVRKTATLKALVECMHAVAAGNTWMEEGLCKSPSTRRGARART
jgi:DNA-binding NarL/FixJ family response regulator